MGLPSRVRARSPWPSNASRNRPRSRAPRCGPLVEEGGELLGGAHAGAAQGAAVEGEDRAVDDQALLAAGAGALGVAIGVEPGDGHQGVGPASGGRAPLALDVGALRPAGGRAR